MKKFSAKQNLGRKMLVRWGQMEYIAVPQGFTIVAEKEAPHI